MARRPILETAAVCRLLYPSLQAQTAPAAPPPQSLTRVYTAFLLRIDSMRKATVGHPERVTSEANMESSMRRRLRLPHHSWQTLVTYAGRVATDYHQHDSEAEGLIKEDRKMLSSGTLPKGQAPPHHDQLVQFDKLRQSAIAADIASMEAALGPDLTSTVRQYVANVAAGNMHPLTPAQVAQLRANRGGAQ